MTVAQIKKSLSRLDEQDRLFVLHYLKHLMRVETESHQRALARRHEEMAGGRRVTLAQVKRLDAAFKAERL